MVTQQTKIEQVLCALTRVYKENVMPEKTILAACQQETPEPAGSTRRIKRKRALFCSKKPARSAHAPRRFPRTLAGITVAAYVAAFVVLTASVLATQNFFLLPLVMLMSLQIAYMFRICVNFIFSSNEVNTSTERGTRTNGKKR